MAEDNYISLSMVPDDDLLQELMRRNVFVMYHSIGRHDDDEMAAHTYVDYKESLPFEFAKELLDDGMAQLRIQWSEEHLPAWFEQLAARLDDIDNDEDEDEDEF